MYFDTKPCSVCGSEVTLRARDTPPVRDEAGPGGPVGERDGVVGEADTTVDERVCTNAGCATNRTRGQQGARTP
jgi:hypothetical protein